MYDEDYKKSVRFYGDKYINLKSRAGLRMLKLGGRAEKIRLLSAHIANNSPYDELSQKVMLDNIGLLPAVIDNFRAKYSNPQHKIRLVQNFIDKQNSYNDNLMPPDMRDE